MKHEQGGEANLLHMICMSALMGKEKFKRKGVQINVGMI